MISWTNERRKLSDLIPWERNPRQISRDQAKRLNESFDQFNQVETIAIGPSNEIYNGHQRLKILIEKYGGDYEVDVRVSSRSLTEKEREKLTVLLHRGAVGDWNFDVLVKEFEFSDLVEWGFTKKELSCFPDNQTDDMDSQIDRADELCEKWHVETGQLWKLGDHRLICGDSTDRSVIDRLMMGETADATITDPPYNVGIVYGENTSDKQSQDEYLKFSKAWFELAKQLSPLVIFTPGTGRHLVNLEMWFTIERPYWMAMWIKQAASTHSPIGGFQAWEPILIYGKPKTRVGTDVYEYCTRAQFSNGVPLDELHPTPKSLKLWTAIINDFTETGATIFEPFSGSGTTLIACHHSERIFRGCELEPKYVAVNLQRWVDVTGKEPVLQG